MNHNDDPLDEVTELGSVSTDTKGPPAGTSDEIGNSGLAGLTDD